ncbi:MAG: hypothetical protein EA398_10370 [Deltaproteobacteria bacterium]|nr:MAG: hypothetical protein EA398_10370 [Deltaproteobacteria bacterium]
MAARRRKRGPQDNGRKGASAGTADRSGSSQDLGSLGHALRDAGLQPDPPRGKKGKKRNAAAPAPVNAPAPIVPEPAPAPPPPRALSPEEAMALAFERLDDPTAWDAKFGGNVASPLGDDVEIVDPGSGETPSTADVPDDDREGPTDDDLLFLEAVGTDVRRMDDRRAALERHSFVGISWHSARQLDTLSAADLHEPTLDGAQRDLLRRSRRTREPMPVLNVRHLRRREALGEIEAFVHHQRREGVRFTRVVTGKGRQSRDGEPVLKPALIAWCAGAGEEHVLGWAPETDQSGRYGSIVLELRAWMRSKT